MSLLRYTRHIGSFPQFQNDDWMLVGQDGGQSIDLDGRTLFVFSDTMLALSSNAARDATIQLPFTFSTTEPCLFLANCAGLTHGDDLQSALEEMRYVRDPSDFPREILVATPEERAAKLRFWPEHGLCVGDRIYLFYLGIQTVNPASIWGFRNVGVGLAVLNPETWECERIRREGDWRLWRHTADDFHFGLQVLRDQDQVFVFGSIRQGYDSHAFLGRAPIEQVHDPEAYCYLMQPGGKWSPFLSEAGSLGVCGGDYSVSYNSYLGKYIMVYVDSYTKTLMLRHSDQLQGPYSDSERIGRVPHRPDSELIYLGFEQSTFSKRNGRQILVSYCQPHFTPIGLVEVCFR